MDAPNETTRSAPPHNSIRPDIYCVIGLKPPIRSLAEKRFLEGFKSNSLN